MIDIIARGAFGNVIQVCSIHDKQIYAMKIMSKSQIVKDNAVQQVKGKQHALRMKRRKHLPRL